MRSPQLNRKTTGLSLFFEGTLPGRELASLACSLKGSYHCKPEILWLNGRAFGTTGVLSFIPARVVGISLEIPAALPFLIKLIKTYIGDST